MGYDVELIQIAVGPEAAFPTAAEDIGRDGGAHEPFASVDEVRAALLRLDGTRPGPDKTIDYLGRGLNHARFHVWLEAIHVDNNLNAAELLKIYKYLLSRYPLLLIHDLQSGQLHNAASFADWWTRPL